MVRERLPNERPGLTHKFRIGDTKGYLTVGLYEDGRPGEVFVKMDRQGSTVSGFADAWAIAISMLLQSGVPVQDICEKFKSSRFPPDGLTGTDPIRIATSPIDYIARWLEHHFVPTPKEDA